MREKKLARLYWQSVKRYERRLGVWDRCNAVIQSLTATPEEQLVAVMVKHEYRPLIRQALDLAASLDLRLFDQHCLTGDTDGQRGEAG